MPVSLNNRITLKNGKKDGIRRSRRSSGCACDPPAWAAELAIRGTNPNLVQSAEQLHLRNSLSRPTGDRFIGFPALLHRQLPELIAEFADQLKLERFAGRSLLERRQIRRRLRLENPERLTQAIVVAGSAPFDLPGVKEALSKGPDRQLTAWHQAALCVKIMLGKMPATRRNNPASVMSLFTDISEADKTTHEDPDMLETPR